MATAGAIAGGIAGAAGDLFGGLFAAKGNKAEAQAYGVASDFAKQNAVISQEAGTIKEAQTQRQIFKTVGAQEAQVAGAGLAESGSAQYLLQNSVAQGSLEKAIVNEQTQINVTGYQQQAAQFKGMQDAATAAAHGSTIGGIFGAIGSILKVLI